MTTAARGCSNLAAAVRPQPRHEGEPMAFHYRLEREDGTPSDPPTFHTAVPAWGPGDTIPLGAGRTFRVVEIRPAKNADENGVLVVEAV
jgi:hypothetical protein